MTGCLIDQNRRAYAALLFSNFSLTDSTVSSTCSWIFEAGL